MNYIQVIRVIVSESMTVSNREADKLKATNKLSAGEICAQIHRITMIANGYNQINTSTVLKHAVTELYPGFNQVDFRRIMETTGSIIPSRYLVQLCKIDILL